MPLDAAKDYAGAIVAAVIGIVAAAWGFLVMFFSMRTEVARAHTRIDSLDRKVDTAIDRLLEELKEHKARDIRIENKLDRLIESRRG